MEKALRMAEARVSWELLQVLRNISLVFDFHQKGGSFKVVYSTPPFAQYMNHCRVLFGIVL
jgi:hypothetical protein